MNRLRQTLSRLGAFFRQRRLNAEMAEEMRQHLELRAERNLAAGMAPEEARYAAQRSFGNLGSVQEQARDERGFRWLEDFFRDLGFAARSLRKTPGLTAVIVLSLALGIGANTAMFSVVNAVLLRPLPYAEPERLVFVQMLQPDGRWWSVSNGDYVDWRAHNRVFEDIAVMVGAQAALTGGDEAERVQGQRVSGNFFALLGIRPVLGRTFLPEEETRPGAPVVVLSYGLWQRRFGGDPYIIGKKLTLDTTSCDIIGIMPAGFKTFRAQGDHRTEFWRPYPFGAESMDERKISMLQTVARLKPGISVERAHAELNLLHERSVKELGLAKAYARMKVLVRPAHDWIVADERSNLWVLLGAVSLVLLIAIANVANLLLARGAARQKEIAVRLALGASRWRVIRQLLTEALLLALCGGLIGVLVAVWGQGSLVRLIPSGIPRVDEISIDLRVLGLTVLVTVLTGLLFGLAPAVGASKPDLNDVLNQGGRSAIGGRDGQVLRNALVVVEVGMALVLLFGAGLMVNSLARALAMDFGIQKDKVLALQVQLSRWKYGIPAGTSSGSSPQKLWAVRPERMVFVDQVLQRIEALPGVVSAAISPDRPVASAGPVLSFKIEGRAKLSGARPPEAAFVAVTPRHFETMGIGLLRGRQFTERDRDGAPAVGIISEKMARQHWPNEDPIGKRVTPNLWAYGCADQRSYEVVGIVADTRAYADGRSWPTMFIPIDQQGKRYEDIGGGYASYTLSLNILVRTVGEPSGMAAAVRAAIKEVDPNQPVQQIATMQQVISGLFAKRNFAMVLLSLFAGVALVLSAAGIYGVMAYAVTQRTHEIGVRMALGASRRDVLEMVIRRGMRFALLGVAVGLAGAIATSHLLKSLLYEITPTDPLTAVSVTLLLTGVAFLACYIPARCATKLDPMVALRCE